MTVRHPLIELTVARVKEFVRQPEAVFWVLAFPIILAMALGFAFREKEPERIPIGVIEGSRGDYMEALTSSPALKVVEYEPEAGAEALRTGRVSLLVDAREDVKFSLDETRPDARIARLESGEAIQRAAGRQDVVQIVDQRIEEKGSRYIDFLIPGLLGMNLMGTGMWGVGFSVATSRMQKLLKRLIATPMSRTHYFLAFILSRIVFLVLEVAVIVAFGWIVFDVAVRGSMLVFALVSLVGAFTFSGLGLLVASRSQTIEGVSGLMNLVMVPMWILSGVFFSSERFPDWSQPFIQALPLTALNDALRAVMLEAAGFGAIALDLLVMVAWLVISFLVALKIFRWT